MLTESAEQETSMAMLPSGVTIPMSTASTPKSGGRLNMAILIAEIYEQDEQT